MGTRGTPLRFVCRGCGKQAETYRTNHTGIYCNKQCRADAERTTSRKPGRYKNADGYWMLRWNIGDGKHKYKFEHRHVWEQHNGREVPDGYIIHHINEIKDDNRIENLQLMRRSDHGTHHHKGVPNPRKGRKVAR